MDQFPHCVTPWSVVPSGGAFWPEMRSRLSGAALQCETQPIRSSVSLSTAPRIRILRLDALDRIRHKLETWEKQNGEENG